jgi:hypothetical protein
LTVFRARGRLPLDQPGRVGHRLASDRRDELSTRRVQSVKGCTVCAELIPGGSSKALTRDEGLLPLTWRSPDPLWAKQPGALLTGRPYPYVPASASTMGANWRKDSLSTTTYEIPKSSRRS